MATTLNAVTIANPVDLSSDSIAVAATNITYAGMKSYYHNRVANVNQIIHVLSVTWQDLSPAELALIRTNWQVASDGYVYFTFDNVELPSVFTTPDQLSVIVYPGSTLDVEYTQAYNGAGVGPVLYNVTATFTSEPMSVT